METRLEAPRDPQTIQNEDFEQERTVTEQQEYTYYVRPSIMVLAFRLLTLQVLIMCSHLISYIAVMLNGVNELGGFVILATITIQFINLGVSLFLTLTWVKTIYIIRPNSITEHSGIIFFNENEYSTARIESVNVSQSLWGKIFNYGTIHVFNPVLKEDLNIEDIPHPYIYAHLISKRPGKESIRFIPHREDIHH